VQWQWLNEPEEWTGTEDGLKLHTLGEVDFWRETLVGTVRDSGHFYFTEVTGDFIATVCVAGDYRDQYDQAGLVVRHDERNYLKSGVEFVKGSWEGRFNYRGDARLLNTALTVDGWSEWSVNPQLPTEPERVWIRVEREKGTFFVSHSLDGREFTVMKMFAMPGVDTVAVGPYATSPEGGGFDVAFSELSITGGGVATSGTNVQGVHA
jgi:regulation of enolase protein 1 (concanavalin A-like superfamily)